MNVQNMNSKAFKQRHASYVYEWAYRALCIWSKAHGITSFKDRDAAVAIAEHFERACPPTVTHRDEQDVAISFAAAALSVGVKVEIVSALCQVCGREHVFVDMIERVGRNRFDTTHRKWPSAALDRCGGVQAQGMCFGKALVQNGGTCTCNE